MKSKRDDYKKLIEETPLFSLSKEESPTAYRREYLRLVENLYCYLMAVNESRYEEFGLEITETANRCIKNYNASIGNFLNYFLAAWKQEYSHALGKKIVIENTGGLKLSSEDVRNIRRFIKYRAERQDDFNMTQYVNAIAQAMEIDEKQVEELLSISNLRVVSDIAINNDGEEYSLIDQIAEDSVIQTFIENDVEDTLIKIEQVYLASQERQHLLLAKLITSKLWELAESNDAVYAQIKQRQFFDEGTFQKCRSQQTAISAKTIGASMGLLEASVSRTYHGFIERLKKEMQ